MKNLQLFDHEEEVLKIVLNRILALDLNSITPTIHDYRTIASISGKLQLMNPSTLESLKG